MGRASGGEWVGSPGWGGLVEVSGCDSPGWGGLVEVSGCGVQDGEG